MKSKLSMGLLVIAAIALAACGKINRDNFDKINDGMSKQEVINLLGEPTESSSASLFGISGGSAVWREGKTEISVQFFNNKVIGKQMGTGEGPHDKLE